MSSWKSYEERLESQLRWVLLDIESPFEIVPMLEQVKANLNRFRLGFEPPHHLVHVLNPHDSELQTFTAELLRRLGCEQVEAASTVQEGPAQPSAWRTRRAVLAAATDRAARNANAAFEALERRLEALEAQLSELEDEDDEHHVVVLDPKLSDIGGLLRARNMYVIDAPTHDLHAAIKAWLLPVRVLVVADEQPFENDAAAYGCGIVSMRLISRRDPQHLAEMVCDALATFSLASEPNGFVLLLRDDGEHVYRPC